MVGDPRFYRRTGPYSLAAVVDAAEAEAPPRRLMFDGIAPLTLASPGEVGFLDNKKYLTDLTATQAGAVIVHPDFADKVPSGTVPIVSSEPAAAWARVAALFHPLAPVQPSIHPSAVVADDARIDPSAEIGPMVYVGSGAVIGPRCRVAPMAAIGQGVVLGADCRIGSHVTLSHAILEDRVTLYPGVRVGQDGFGFTITPQGLRSIPQLGRVLIGHDVEVGANSTIDRGALGDTIIGAGSRLDNLVMIGHNVRMGRCCVIVAQVGIAGSAVLEDFVVMGGQSGLAGHLRIGKGTRVGAQSGVMTNLEPGMEVVGSPAQPVKAFFRELASLRRLVAMRDKQKGRPVEQAAKSGNESDIG